MKILWIGTKPPVPPIDGGRLAVLETLRALRAAGARITLVAPIASAVDAADETTVDEEAVRAELEPICRPRLVPVPQRGRLGPLLGSLAGPPYAIGRHRHPEIATEVARLLDAETFDVVHCEQLHALAQAEPARRRGVPVVLRAQNVESNLWAATAALHPSRIGAGPWLRREARRLAGYEGGAVRSVAATVALTSEDGRQLEKLAGGDTRVAVVPPPFPTQLPPADRHLPGEPAVVLLGSGGWLPNEDAVRWFLQSVWPGVRDRCPGARLHLFAPAGGRALPPGAERHPPPADSRDAFPRGSVHVVPLRIASGIRMKILEAWARGVPVIATPEAAAGLGAKDDEELLVGRSAEGLADAIVRMTRDPRLAEALVVGGRRRLAAHFAPAAVAASLLAVYGETLKT